MKPTVVGLFSGIGGLERGFEQAGFNAIACAETDAHCSEVLERRMPDVPNLGNVAAIEGLPKSDVLVAGFPCQPYSQAGRRDGLRQGSGSMNELLRLIEASQAPTIVLENVTFIVHLHGGSAVTRIVNRVTKLGYDWAYRIVDTRAFGLPQRRHRWIFVASREIDPKRVLFADHSKPAARTAAVAKGFYWTEGSSGIGWADDAVPPLKGAGGFGIPSPPAIWSTADDVIITPEIRDLERLQGPSTETTTFAGGPFLRR